MARNQSNNYFKMFLDQMTFACEAAQCLYDYLNDFNADEISVQIKKMHVIEHNGDKERHDIMHKLVKEFIPPIEREDIMLLSEQIDNITDNIEDVLLCIYMYHVHFISDDAIKFSALVLKCCNELKKAVKEFCNFKKSSTIHEIIIEVNRLEEVGDDLYTDVFRKIFLAKPDPLDAMALAEIYKYLEKCCDACEEVADIIESVIMKNS